MEEDRKAKEEKEYMDALDFLDIDADQVDKKSKFSYKKEQELTNKVTALNEMSLEFTTKLEGKTYDAETGAYVQTGKALVGRDFILLAGGILNSFAANANYLSGKERESFFMQFKDAHQKVNLSLSMRNRAVPEATQRAVLKMFKDTLWNVGDIITGAKGNMEKVFGSNGQKDDFVENRKIGAGGF